jgi:GNAT superfamily N-acetyltransferase
MDSLYAEYILERTDDKILEDSKGFITWRYINDKQAYIVDIFVKKQYRKKNVASKLADYVCSIAKNLGYKEVIGTVVPSTKGSDDSLRVLWGYGMKLFSAEHDLIVMKKDL